MGTSVYIDGFNLYNGSLRGTPYRWLDLSALCNNLLPGRTINRIRYFTATVRGLAHDPGAPTRQNIYLRALGTLSDVSIHKDGWFSAHPVILPQFPLARPFNKPTAKPLRVQVQKMEEKRTDVDLVTHLLLDCFANDFEEAVVISNDSDFVLPIEVVRTQFNKTVGIINPHPKAKISGNLIRAATFHLRTINRSALRSSQFPDSLTDSKGVFTKPPSW